MKHLKLYESFLNEEKTLTAPWGSIEVDGKKINIEEVTTIDGNTKIKDLMVLPKSSKELFNAGIRRARYSDAGSLNPVVVEMNTKVFKLKPGQKMTAAEFVKFANWHGGEDLEIKSKK